MHASSWVPFYPKHSELTGVHRTDHSTDVISWTKLLTKRTPKRKDVMNHLATTQIPFLALKLAGLRDQIIVAKFAAFNRRSACPLATSSSSDLMVQDFELPLPDFEPQPNEYSWADLNQGTGDMRWPDIDPLGIDPLMDLLDFPL